MMRRKTCVVTGGAGFIGANLVRKLLDLGAKVIVFDNLERGRMENLKAVEDQIDIFKVDITKGELPNVKADYVFHLAAKVFGVRRLHTDVANLMSSNIMGDIQVFRWAAKQGVQRLVYASSSCVYDFPGVSVPHVEYEEGIPNTFYGLSKFVGEKLLEAFKEDGLLEWSIARLFNVYGPLESLKSPHVIPEFFIKAYKILTGATKEFEIIGDGEQTRSFLFVDDAVEGLVRLAVTPKAAYEVFNLGTNREMKIKDLAVLVLKTVGIDPKEVRFVHVPAPPRDIRRRSADYSKAKKILDWQPRVDLEEGLKITWMWMRRVLEKA